MTPIILSARQQRVLAVALFGGVALLLGSLVLWPLASRWQRNRSWEHETLDRIAAMRGLAEERGELERLQSRLQGAALSHHALTGSTEVATRQLQNEVRAIISASGVSLQSLQPVPSRDAGRLEAVGVQLIFVATIDQLAGFLERLEHAGPLYRLDDVEVSAPAGQDRSQNPPLNVRLNLLGYRVSERTAS